MCVREREREMEKTRQTSFFMLAFSLGYNIYRTRGFLGLPLFFGLRSGRVNPAGIGS